MDFLWLLEGIRTPFLNQVFQFITYFGQEVIIIAVICTLFWCVDKRFAYQLGFTYFTAGLCVQALKVTFRIPRPWVLDSNFHAVESAVHGATGYSFPSGHTQGATSLFAPIALRSRRIWVKILCVLAFLLIGFSRMYLGCHTPKDVLVSMGLSLFFSWLIWHYQDSVFEQKQYRRYIVLAMIVISLLVCVYALTLFKNGTIEERYAMDCFRAAGAGLGFSIGWYIERTWLDFSVKTATLWGQLLKLVIGLLAALVIKSEFSHIFGHSLLAKTAQYFVLVLWVLVIYPYCFSKMQKLRNLDRIRQ